MQDTARVDQTSMLDIEALNVVTELLTVLREEGLEHFLITSKQSTQNIVDQ